MIFHYFILLYFTVRLYVWCTMISIHPYWLPESNKLCGLYSGAATTCRSPCKWRREQSTRAFILVTAHAGHQYSILISGLKFAGLPVPKTWLIFDHDVNRPGDLDLSICKWVTGHSCHGLPSCQFLAFYALPFST